MSKPWYPVIDYSLCAECGICTDKCQNGVYDVSKAPTPVVVNQQNCIEGYHGCGNLCPQGAICYVGDSPDRTNESSCNCDTSCNCDCDCC